MDDTFNRMINDLFSRLDGPLHFRFFLQPAMATFFAIRDGLHDAREGRPAYFWSLFFWFGAQVGFTPQRLEISFKDIHPCYGSGCHLPTHCPSLVLSS